ncbi:class A beta-lactamase [Variovorax sp. RHLX14]|uniref:class A beta-lactamase n=1 Tax=Variovorax sp. RHLX14 TaxID=1259731 RepID=UPI003F44906E
MQRRQFSMGAGVVIASAALGATAQTTGVDEALECIEAASGGRLGVCILDTATGRRTAYRADERFPMCSTFKFLAAAFVLQRSDSGLEKLTRAVAIPAKADLVPYSPATGPSAGGTMTMAQLCDAAITLSDNTAANLMLASFGGPAGLTGFTRALGDRSTRLDRIEPLLNEATPGDERDTTTPAAMLGLMEKLLVENTLKPASRERLTAWLLANTTGARQIRAGVPDGWRVGDKTGAGGHGTGNDIAIVWPPGKDSAPFLVTAYLTGTSGPVEQRHATLAAVGALLPTIAGRS